MLNKNFMITKEMMRTSFNDPGWHENNFLKNENKLHLMLQGII